MRTEFDGNLIICNIQEMAFLNLLQERFIIMKEREREKENGKNMNSDEYNTNSLTEMIK